MVDVAQAAVDRGLAAIGASLERLEKKEKITAGERASALSRIRATTDYADLKAANLIIEAATENYPQHRRSGRLLIGGPPIGHNAFHGWSRHTGQPRRGHRIGGDHHVARAECLVAIRDMPSVFAAANVDHPALQFNSILQAVSELTGQCLNALGG